MATEASPELCKPFSFFTLPPELRLKIYKLLLVPSSQDSLSIRNENSASYEARKMKSTYSPLRRLSYRIFTNREGYEFAETTFRLLINPGLHPQILGTNQQIHDEAARILYGSYSFDFSTHVESVVPFLSGLSAPALFSIKRITLGQPVYLLPKEHDRKRWKEACAFVANNLNIQQLTLIIHAGRPKGPLLPIPNASDVFTRLDYEQGLTKLGYLGWTEQLLNIKDLRTLTIEPIWKDYGEWCTETEWLYFNFSASIKAGFEEFLQAHMVAKAA